MIPENTNVGFSLGTLATSCLWGFSCETMLSPCLGQVNAPEAALSK